MNHVSKWKLRRLAPRALRVFERHFQKTPALAAYQVSLVPSAQEFMSTYDRLRVLEAARKMELSEGRRAVGLLHRGLRGWVAQLSMGNVIPDFDRTDYGDNPAVMDDVISDAEALIDLVTTHAAHIPFADALLADLTALLETAKTEWTQAEALKQSYQDLIKENDTAAEALQQSLVAFRQTLAATIGRRDPDYHLLRASKIARDQLEPGEEVGLPPDLVPGGEDEPALEEVGEEVDAAS